MVYTYFCLSKKAFGLYLPLVTMGQNACSFHSADLPIAQPNADGTPLFGSELKLGVSVRDKALKNLLETKYFDCHEPVSTEKYHLPTLNRTHSKVALKILRGSISHGC